MKPREYYDRPDSQAAEEVEFCQLRMDGKDTSARLGVDAYAYGGGDYGSTLYILSAFGPETSVKAVAAGLRSKNGLRFQVGGGGPAEAPETSDEVDDRDEEIVETAQKDPRNRGKKPHSLE